MTVCQPRATSDTLVAADWDWVCSSCRSSTPICADDSNKKRRGRVGGSGIGSGRGGRANQMYVENGEYMYIFYAQYYVVAHQTTTIIENELQKKNTH